MFENRNWYGYVDIFKGFTFRWYMQVQFLKYKSLTSIRTHSPTAANHEIKIREDPFMKHRALKQCIQ